MGNKWSLKYDYCKECRTTERVHKGGGLCSRCIQRKPERLKKKREYYERNREKLLRQSKEAKIRLQNYRKKHNIWHPEFESCIGCGSTDRAYGSKGLCTRCHQRQPSQLTRKREHYKNNRDAILEKNREYNKKNEYSKKRYHKMKKQLLWKKKQHINLTEYGGNMNRAKVRARYKCEDCSLSDKESYKKYGSLLAVHHIDQDRTNNNMENLKCLCVVCHQQYHLKTGEKNFLTTLKDDDIREIRSLKGKVTSIELGNRYNVDRCTISKIWNNKNWKHII